MKSAIWGDFQIRVNAHEQCLEIMDGAVIQRVHGQAPDLKNQDRLKCIESKFTDSDKKNVPSRVQILSWKCCLEQVSNSIHIFVK